MINIIRTTAFLGKEIAEVMRQPRLILALVFGPFLILLLFGLGYRNEARPVRTLFVVDPKAPLAKEIEQSAPTISPQLVYLGATANEQEAKDKLKAGQVDMVVVMPNNAYETLRQNQQVPFQIYHNEIDPAQVGYIEYLGQIFVNEVNRRVLSSVAAQGQTDAASVKNDVSAARQNAQAMKTALQAGNAAEARMQQQGMQRNVGQVALAVGSSVGLLSGVQQNLGTGNQSADAQNV
ncbi:MAG TPA: ABC transporter permease, partial [Anaerolineales bacterium]